LVSSPWGVGWGSKITANKNCHKELKTASPELPWTK